MLGPHTQDLEVTWQDLHEDVVPEPAPADSQDEESDGKRTRPAKEPRMTTNKRKRTNYYGDANVKNRRR